MTGGRAFPVAALVGRYRSLADAAPEDAPPPRRRLDAVASPAADGEAVLAGRPD